MLADCASGPVLVIYEGSFEDLSAESRAVLQELLSLGAEPLGARTRRELGRVRHARMIRARARVRHEVQALPRAP